MVSGIELEQYSTGHEMLNQQWESQILPNTNLNPLEKTSRYIQLGNFTLLHTTRHTYFKKRGWFLLVTSDLERRACFHVASCPPSWLVGWWHKIRWFQQSTDCRKEVEVVMSVKSSWSLEEFLGSTHHWLGGMLTLSCRHWWSQIQNPAEYFSG